LNQNGSSEHIKAAMILTTNQIGPEDHTTPLALKGISQ